ncbi:hypothetical protein [Terrabacter sp. NPDC000476]
MAPALLPEKQHERYAVDAPCPFPGERSNPRSIPHRPVPRPH